MIQAVTRFKREKLENLPKDIRNSIGSTSVTRETSFPLKKYLLVLESVIDLVSLMRRVSASQGFPTTGSDQSAQMDTDLWKHNPLGFPRHSHDANVQVQEDPLC